MELTLSVKSFHVSPAHLANSLSAKPTFGPNLSCDSGHLSREKVAAVRPWC